MNEPATWNVRPLTPERWGDFERLFGRAGAYGGCWCMWFRQTGKEYEAGRGEPNKQAMCDLVSSNATPGLILYSGETPAGWVAVEPRTSYPRLERSRAARRIDDADVWSVVCFFVHRDFRGKRATVRLLEAAIEHAGAEGAHILEAYPKDLADGRPSADAAYVGLLPVFLAAGFTEVARQAKGRPMVRLKLPRA
ncbi:MAG: GNAT family N-acetyltransferase [Dehalococcoidia bacterium]